MEKDQQNLKKLILFLEDIIKHEENEWMVQDLFELVTKHLPEDQISNHPVIKRINEYCIEEVIKSQAEDFYKDFPIVELKNQLIEDFISMEHQRRRNDFERFGISMFQQIELITNHLFRSQSFRERLKRERKLPAYFKWNAQKQKNLRGDGASVEQVLLMMRDEDIKKGTNIYYDDNGFPNFEFSRTSKNKTWSILQMIRAIIYYYYLGGEVKPFDMDAPYETCKMLYNVRNRVHRGGYNTLKVEEIQKRIFGNESKFYLHFYGFLETFTTRIIMNLSSDNANNTLKKKNQKKENKPVKTTLGDFPGAEKLIEIKQKALPDEKD
ncbi:MAG: hypothetical protein JXB49_33260 [Bacteroidales bacterium]|nr:hypothetical protein [Bacteroidales bacterium]